jgi:predicted anti-sigma-YlaC factor YlaD
VRDLSSEYLDGELDQQSSDEVKTHLEMCPPCRTFFDTLLATISLLMSSSKAEATASFRERLRERLHQERHR